MAENRYSQVHTLKNVDVVSDLSQALPDRYVILKKEGKRTIDVRLNRQVKMYIDGNVYASSDPTTPEDPTDPDPTTPVDPNPPVDPDPVDPDPVDPNPPVNPDPPVEEEEEEEEVINAGEIYMLYDYEVGADKNDDKFVLTVNGEGLKSEIQENGQLKWTIPAGTALVELPSNEGEAPKYGLSIEGNWGFPKAMTEEVIASYGYLGLEYNMSYDENFYGIVNYTNLESTATILISIETDDGLGGQWTIPFEETPQFVNIKIYIESDSADFVTTEDQYLTLANLALLPKDEDDEIVIS